MAFLLKMVGINVHYPDTISFVDKKLSNWQLNTTGVLVHLHRLVSLIYDNLSHIRHCKNTGKNNRIIYIWHTLALTLFFLILLVQMLQNIQKQIHSHSFFLSYLAIYFLIHHDDLHLLILGYSLQKHLLQLSLDRKSTRLNSSHVSISYAVFCLKKK